MNKHLIIAFFMFTIILGYGQCTNCNSQYPLGTFSTTSGTLTVVASDIKGGDWAEYSVINGETYTWTTCGDTDFDTQLTLRTDNCSGTLLAYNDDDCGLRSTITWTATFTGNVYVLLSEYSCANNSKAMTIQWACTSCVNTIAQDCNVASTICNQTEQIVGNASGYGTQELNSSNRGCLEENENNSVWVYFHMSTDANIVFTITSISTDYDFAIWEGIECPPNSQPIRCSWAWDYGSYDTGLDLTSTDVSESDNFDNEGNWVDGYVKYIAALEGEEYTMLIDNYDSDNQAFNLTWDMNSVVLDCSTLPIEIFNELEYNCETNKFTWATSSEINNELFSIRIGKGFDKNGNLIIQNNFTIEGNDFSNSIIFYEYEVNVENNMYVELWQTDFDGSSERVGKTKIINCNEYEKTIKVYPNPIRENEHANIDGNYEKIELYNLLGEKLVANIIDNKIMNLSTGMYVVVIDGHFKVKLIVKQ